MVKGSIRLMVVICALAQLCACGMPHRTKNLGTTAVAGTANTAMAAPVAAGSAATGLLADTFGIGLTKYNQLVSDLKSQGVLIQPNGQEMTVIIPVDDVFISCTPRMREDAAPLMAQLSQFFQYYNKVSVQIDVYSDKQADVDRALALTRAQARVFSRYLWEHNFDARVLSAQGHGGILPIGNNGVSEGKDLNRRIEVTFRNLS